jgi:hypothetical protein
MTEINSTEISSTEVNVTTKREIFARVSIGAGNVVQLGGIAVAVVLLVYAPALPRRFGAASMTAAWILLYFCCHAIAHWIVGRMVGIRFVGYTVGGTGNPGGYPMGLRWVFARLPFMGVQTEKGSMHNAGGGAKAMMWSAGVTSSAVVPTLGAVWARYAGIAGSKGFLIFAVVWALGTLASNWTSRTGDFAKAQRALRT